MTVRGDEAGKRQDPFVRGRSDTDIYLRTSRERKNRNALDEADGVTGTGCRLVQGEECLLPFMIRRLSQETRFPSAITTFWSSQPKEWAGIIFTEDMTKQKISPKLRDQSLRGIYRLGSSCDHLPLVGPSKRCRERRQCMCTPPHVGDSRNRLEPVVISENHGEIHVLFNSSGKRRKEKNGGELSGEPSGDHMSHLRWRFRGCGFRGFGLRGSAFPASAFLVVIVVFIFIFSA